ncbi:MAG: DUF2917 domain-containing protein [Propionivibrio sp.]
MVAILTDQVARNVGEVVLLPPRSAQVVHAIDGILWITQAGETEDILLHAGESRSFSGRGRIAVQPFQGSATFVVEKAPGRLRKMTQGLADRILTIARRLAPVGPADHAEPVSAAPCGRLNG